MRGQRINRVSGLVLIGLSLTALLTVLSAFRVTFDPFSLRARPALPDEGTQAHLFQLSILAMAPTALLFLATADWERPSRNVRPLAVSIAAAVAAFGALYYLEHHL